MMHRKCIRNLATALAALMWAACGDPQPAAQLPSPDAPARTKELRSPDGKLEVRVSDEGGRLRYEVNYDGEAVVFPSRLGLLFRKHFGFDEGMAIAGATRRSGNSTWELPWGERRNVRDHHNELLIEARNGASGEILRIRFRAFDDGVGFRYELPKRSGGRMDIVKELTEFALPRTETRAWWIPSDRHNRYEYLYRTSGLDEMDRVHTPSTFRLQNGIHLSIHEAALVDYSAMSLLHERPGVFRAALRPWSDGVLVKAEPPFVTPWRTLQISPDAVGLINSDLILNLNEPNQLGDVSWVKPAKYVGIWWAMHIRDRTWGRDGVHGASTEEVLRYMDFAAEHGFAGVLVEGWNLGWDGDWYSNGEIFSFTESYPDFDIARIAAYGREKGVELIGHHETSGHITNYERQMEAAFQLYKDMGVTMVKTGYVADAGELKWIDEKGIPRFEYHDSQFMVRHHLKVVQAAARYGISVNPHEPVKDTGLRRTWPNWVTREGARGQEYNAWGSPPNSPEHTAILPWTRMLSGPMDFTPGIFDLRPNERPPVREDMPRNNRGDIVPTTLAKQLSLYVVIHSPLQMAADLPENYEKRPNALQFIRDVPADWEQSIALAGEIGDYIAIARQERGGPNWFLGALTDENARKIEINLSFLDADARYLAEIYHDGANAHWRSNPYSIRFDRLQVRANNILPLQLAPGGGAAVRFVRQ